MIWIVSVLSIGEASAGACSKSKFKYNVSCDNGGSDVCYSSGASWYCNLDANGVSTLYSTAYISDEGTFGVYMAYGTDTSGALFCCEVSTSIVTGSIYVYGSDVILHTTRSML